MKEKDYSGDDMNRQAVVRELVAVAKILARVSVAAKKPRHTAKDIQAIIKKLEDFIHRGGRDYGDYQFNIKLHGIDVPDSVTEEHGDNTVNDFAMEEAALRVRQLGEDIKRRFAWVGDWGQSGRSGGWFVLIDEDKVMDTLEHAMVTADDRDELDEEGPWFEDEWNDREEEVNEAVKEGQQRLRDLNEIEKMVKSGISDYRKDMNSEQWWKRTLR